MAPCFTVPACGNGSGQARLEEPLYGCFSWVVQSRRAPPRPSTRRLSRFPRLRVPRTERTLTDLEPIWPQRLRQALHQYQTHGDVHEATRAGIARPGGRAWPGAPSTWFRSSGRRASIRRPKPPGRLSNGTPEYPTRRRRLMNGPHIQFFGTPGAVLQPGRRHPLRPPPGGGTDPLRR